MVESVRVTWIVDRLEGDWAVVEVDVGKTIELPLAWLPPGAGEGTHLRVTHDVGADFSSLVLRVDRETADRRARQNRSLPKPGRGDPGGNVSL